MKVAVVGLWHLGTVAAACLSQVCETVVAVDEPNVVANLNAGKLPVNEPGLAELIEQATAGGKLRFSAAACDLAEAELILVAYDTPVDEDDNADVDYVYARILGILPHLRDGATVLISSQVPVGFTNRVAAAFASMHSDKVLHFAYSPENLRLGAAINCFKNPGRVVVGTDSEAAHAIIETVFGHFTGSFIWMTATSAEMTKHAVNAYLGMSISFINEIATLCELVGADAKEVERGLRSEPRIGERAPLSPGGAFAGGTLARDITYLVGYGDSNNCRPALLSAIKTSNDQHKRWALRRLNRELGDLSGAVVAVLGLTYKADTNTLRRSSSLELCRALRDAGAIVRAHDPAIAQLPSEFDDVQLTRTAQEAYSGARALVLATGWTDYKKITPTELLQAMKQPLIVDPGGFLRASLDGQAQIRYLAVGAP